MQGFYQFGDKAFKGTSLESVKLPKTVQSISPTAFSRIQNLKLLDLSQTRIDEMSCFKLFGYVQDIILPRGVSLDDEYEKEVNENGEEVVVIRIRPNYHESWGEPYNLDDVKKLYRALINEKVKKIKLIYGKGCHDICIPGSDEIEEMVKRQSYKIESLHIPGSAEGSIETYACNLKHLRIAKRALVNITDYCFANSPVRAKLAPKMHTINNQGVCMGYYEVRGDGLIIDCDDEKEQNDKVRDINEDDEGEI